MCMGFLWRMVLFCGAPISVAHVHLVRHRNDDFCGAGSHAPQKPYFSGEVSVAHPHMCHRKAKWVRH